MTFDVSPACPGSIGHYSADIGRSRYDLMTPALLLDLEVVRKNVQQMVATVGPTTRVRPHVKSHKCPQLARLQIKAGAIGVTAATVWEALVMAEAGIDNILIANEVVGEEKIRRLANACRTIPIMVAVDDLDNATALAAAACQAGSEIGVLLDIDIGMNRCGVRSAEEALALAAHVGQLRGLRLHGAMGYEGHCVLEASRSVRESQAHAAVDFLLSVVDALEARGFEMSIVSGGGTGTYDITGVNPRMTELQVGTYLFNDLAHSQTAPAFPIGLSVLATVVSRHGTRVVLDSGKKVIGGAELALPHLRRFDAKPVSLAEEHALFDVPTDSSLQVGDRVEVVPGYAATTVNLHEVFHVIESGTVMDIWPILARGSGRNAV